jgi:hypothetical protein
LQALLLFLVPALVAICPPGLAAREGLAARAVGALGLEVAKPAPEEPFASALVLAVASSPMRALVALKHSGSRFTVALRFAEGAAAPPVSLDFPDEKTRPEFAADKLLAMDKVAALVEQHGLRTVEPAALASHGKALLARKHTGRETVLTIVTSAGEQELSRYPEAARLSVQAWYDPAASGVAVAGAVDPDGDGPEPATGFYRVLSFQPEFKKLEGEQVAAIGLEEASWLVVHGRAGEAALPAALAVKAQESAEALHLASVSLAYAQDWKGSTKHLSRLRADKSEKARELVEETLRHPPVREAALRTLDLNGAKEISFKASKGYEGTSVWVKIKDARGENVAVFKPTNSNTYHRGEVFTYQMAKLLGTEALYPVSILHTLDKKGCKKLVAALEAVSYEKLPAKEARRKRLLQQCKKGTLEGAVKEWVPDFQFFQAVGTVERFKKTSIYKQLVATGPQPKAGEYFKTSTVTRLYKPDNCRKATYRASLERSQLAVDMSDLMVMDVLNANEDRFPGANVDFKSLGKGKETKPCDFDFGPSRLFSLDNGATFKGTYSNAFVDFTKRAPVSRFRRETWQRLSLLKAFLDGKQEAPFFVQDWGIGTKQELSCFLALDKGDDHKRRKEPFKLFEANLKAVLQHIAKYEKNKGAWFE